MSLKCTTADSKSIPYKTTHPLYPFWCWGRGRKSGWSGGGPVMPPPLHPHSKNHATAHTPPRTPRDKASKNEEEKKQNPGGLKMHNKGGAAGYYHTNEARRDTTTDQHNRATTVGRYKRAHTHTHRGGESL